MFYCQQIHPEGVCQPFGRSHLLGMDEEVGGESIRRKQAMNRWVVVHLQLWPHRLVKPLAPALPLVGTLETVGMDLLVVEVCGIA